jgi:hypothetical protein
MRRKVFKTMASAMEEVQTTIEERAPEFLPFLQFVEGTQNNPVEAKGMKVSYNDKELILVVTAVYLYALHKEE